MKEQILTCDVCGARERDVNVMESHIVTCRVQFNDLSYIGEFCAECRRRFVDDNLGKLRREN